MYFFFCLELFIFIVVYFAFAHSSPIINDTVNTLLNQPLLTNTTTTPLTLPILLKINVKNATSLQTNTTKLPILTKNQNATILASPKQKEIKSELIKVTFPKPTVPLLGPVMKVLLKQAEMYEEKQKIKNNPEIKSSQVNLIKDQSIENPIAHSPSSQNPMKMIKPIKIPVASGKQLNKTQPLNGEPPAKQPIIVKIVHVRHRDIDNDGNVEAVITHTNKGHGHIYQGNNNDRGSNHDYNSVKKNQKNDIDTVAKVENVVAALSSNSGTDTVSQTTNNDSNSNTADNRVSDNVTSSEDDFEVANLSGKVVKAGGSNKVQQKLNNNKGRNIFTDQ